MFSPNQPTFIVSTLHCIHICNLQLRYLPESNAPTLLNLPLCLNVCGLPVRFLCVMCLNLCGFPVRSVHACGTCYYASTGYSYLIKLTKLRPTVLVGLYYLSSKLRDPVLRSVHILRLLCSNVCWVIVCLVIMFSLIVCIGVHLSSELRNHVLRPVRIRRLMCLNLDGLLDCSLHACGSCYSDTGHNCLVELIKALSIVLVSIFYLNSKQRNPGLKFVSIHRLRCLNVCGLVCFLHICPGLVLGRSVCATHSGAIHSNTLLINSHPRPHPRVSILKRAHVVLCCVPGYLYCCLLLTMFSLIMCRADTTLPL
jgi:hypothetical protein